MPNKFKASEKVIQKGTSAPVMTIEGNAMITSYPKYVVDTEKYVCTWQSKSSKERMTFHEDDLELYGNNI